MQISYKPGNSFLYSLNPLIKGGLCFVLIMFFSLNGLQLPAMAGSLVELLLFAALGRLPLADLLLSIRRIWFLLVIVGLVQGFRGNGFEVVPALESMARILGVFIAAGCYLTVSPQSELMFFWETVFRPLRLLGLPARELALVMVIAVRFLPVMLSEIDRIRMAQIARGARLGKGGFFSSAAALMPLMIPTLAQAIIRGEELAEAMEARGYRVSGNRTRYHRFGIGFFDIPAGLAALAVAAIAVWSRMP